jgi:hypothetical protein
MRLNPLLFRFRFGGFSQDEVILSEKHMSGADIGIVVSFAQQRGFGFLDGFLRLAIMIE